LNAKPFEKLAAGEIVLVFEAGQVHGLGDGRRAVGRILGRHAGVLIVGIVVVKTGREDVAHAHIALDLEQIANAPVHIVIHAGGQLFLDDVVVLTISRFEKPQASFGDRPGKCEARIHFVKNGTVPVLHGRDEVCDGKAEVVIAGGGIQFEHAARILSILN
jgi:hypothetical protein